jgi:signal-transduction protein with cAMP-binding, CBS, and nucleotidyltransferase domain
MLCPVCRTDNFEGEDTCGNCGADLRASDTPEPPTEFGDTVLGDQLHALGAGAPVIVPPSMPVGEAVRRMHEGGTDCLLVCEGDRLLGIFTDRDAVVKVAGADRSAEVRAFMTPDPVVLDREDTIAVAIHKMAVGGFRHIPVVDGASRDHVVGVVSAADVFRHLAASLA